jgi:hypothetical protein
VFDRAVWTWPPTVAVDADPIALAFSFPFYSIRTNRRPAELVGLDGKQTRFGDGHLTAFFVLV